MSRNFFSHSSRNNREALALKVWLESQGWKDEVFLDYDPVSGIKTGMRWKEALAQANARCEAIICLISPEWADSPECVAEYRTAENLGKKIFIAQIAELGSEDKTREWQGCRLFGDGPITEITLGLEHEPVRFLAEGLGQIVIKSIQEALTEEMIKVAVEKALAKHRAGEGAKVDQRTTIERELSLIAAKQEHLVDAIAAGDKDRLILDRLRAEEARREELVKELEQLERTEQIASLDEARFKRELRTRLADVRGLLKRHVPSARRLLQTLLEHPLRCEAVREGDLKNYRITGTGSYLPLLSEGLEPLKLGQESCSVVGGVPNGNIRLLTPHLDGLILPFSGHVSVAA
jgi:hypothetical protein